MKSKKVLQKRVITFTECTYEDGSQQITPEVDDFNDFELIGILTYYKDVFQVRMMRNNEIKN